MEETLEIRYVRPEDKAFWYSLDRHLPEEEFDKKTVGQRGYVLLAEGQRAGILRYNLFWDNTPFCTLMYIDPRFQRKGFGWRLMEHWENDMRARGFGMLLTSTQVDEEAQHFYRKLGYKDCGGLVVDIPGYEQPMELFLAKGIEKRSSF
ncbi:MAG: GNAT family N-acetyltransferase [Clostridium sp.]|nr:GNAT family N-acetyltransferase [Clostridium sp.]